MQPTPKPLVYIEDGYNITRTDAPNDLGGRLRLNCARTTPEFPEWKHKYSFQLQWISLHTMWSGNLAPDNSDL